MSLPLLPDVSKKQNVLAMAWSSPHSRGLDGRDRGNTWKLLPQPRSELFFVFSLLIIIGFRCDSPYVLVKNQNSICRSRIPPIVLLFVSDEKRGHTM